MTDRELRELLDARPDPVRAERALAGVPEEARREVRALLAVTWAAADQPRPAPSAGFDGRAMTRIRAAPPPRPGLLRRLLPARVPFAGALAASAAAAFLAVAVAHYPARAPGPASPPPRLRARLALVAPEARDVRVAGDFNGWRPEATPLARDGEGRWRVEIPVEPGRRYEYMFVVDGSWVTDPSARAHAEDGFGGQNAILDT